MTAEELLTKYSAMFRAGRERRMTILNADGSLSEWSLVVQRIERALLKGQATEKDEETLNAIADEFRAAKQRATAPIGRIG